VRTFRILCKVQSDVNKSYFFAGAMAVMVKAPILKLQGHFPYLYINQQLFYIRHKITF